MNTKRKDLPVRYDVLIEGQRDDLPKVFHCYTEAAAIILQSNLQKYHPECTVTIAPVK